MEYQHGNIWHQLPPEQFADLWVEDLAYIKPKQVGENRMYAIHTADGSEVAVVKKRELACATITQNDLEPVSVH